MRMTDHSRWPIVAAIVVGLMPFAGCAWWDGADRRNFEAAMSRASTALAVASTEEARSHAGSELVIAQEKLAAARQTASGGDYAAADRLIAESLVNIQLAAAKVDAARRQDELQQMKASPPRPADTGTSASEGPADSMRIPE
jgi:formate-dependent phosphoribosylglycinamide formyltransferase (GAR transformylase)